MTTKALERIRAKIASNEELWALIQVEWYSRISPLEIQYGLGSGLMLSVAHLEKKMFNIHISKVPDGSIFTTHTLRASTSTFDNLDKEALRLVRSVK